MLPGGPLRLCKILAYLEFRITIRKYNYVLNFLGRLEGHGGKALIHRGKQCGKYEKPEDFFSKGRCFFSVLKFHKSLAHLGEAC